MHDSLVRLFDLRPIHIDTDINSAEQTGQDGKLKKKQRHGRVMSTDIDGLGWDYQKTSVNDDNWGTSMQASVQFALSWSAPFFVDYEDKFALVKAEPKFNLEVFGDIAVTLHFGFAELTMALNMYPFKFTPFDIKLAIDALHPKRYCTGMGYTVRTFMAQVMVEWNVKECLFGVLGIVTENDKEDCFWRNYKPELPLYQLSYENIGNMEGTYFQNTCANWYSAGWTDFPYSEEFIQTHSGKAGKGENGPGPEEIDEITEGGDKEVDQDEPQDEPVVPEA